MIDPLNEGTCDQLLKLMALGEPTAFKDMRVRIAQAKKIIDAAKAIVAGPPGPHVNTDEQKLWDEEFHRQLGDALGYGK